VNTVGDSCYIRVAAKFV